jgi:hypothetical protein
MSLQAKSDRSTAWTAPEVTVAEVMVAEVMVAEVMVAEVMVAQSEIGDESTAPEDRACFSARASIVACARPCPSAHNFAAHEFAAHDATKITLSGAYSRTLPAARTSPRTPPEKWTAT